MKRYITLYYLLFVLLIMGAFASMAQNNYGIIVIGSVAFAFAVIFVAQLVSFLNAAHRADIWLIIESVCIVILATILGLRVFYIHFEYVELIFGLTGLALILVYCRKLVVSWKTLGRSSSLLAMLVVSFNISLILYIASMVAVPFVPAWAGPLGIAAFAILAGFVIAAYVKREFMVSGEKVSAFATVARAKDRSMVLTTLFLVSTLYVALTGINVLPRMYSDEYPQVYFQLINKAETGMEKPVDGQYQYQEFKKSYDQFLKRQASK